MREPELGWTVERSLTSSAVSGGAVSRNCLNVRGGFLAGADSGTAAEEGPWAALSISAHATLWGHRPRQVRPSKLRLHRRRFCEKPRPLSVRSGSQNIRVGPG